MKNVLYIGNALRNQQTNTSYMFSLIESLESLGFKIAYASDKRTKIFRLLHMCTVLWKHRKRTDVVLIDTYSTLNFYYALIISQLCRFYKLKYIPILHGGNLPRRLKKSARFSAKIFNNAHLNISPSNYLLHEFQIAGFHNVKSIPNALEIRNYKWQKRELKMIKLLWVRSFSVIYNPLIALDVFKYLKDLGYNAELCMVGPDKDGSLDKTRNYARKLELNVKFTGKLSRQEWIVLSKDYNVFINTTNVDNTPVSVIEAMALGLPVVSTNVGGMPYLIENEINGILVEPLNPKHMAEAIIKLHSNQEFIHTLTSNARKKVEQFDWDIVKYKWLEILN